MPAMTATITTAVNPAVDGATVPRAAFKDWALACEALGRGRQSLILRKGGLAEGRGGFEFRHDAFWLFPTQYHEQAAKIRPEELPALREGLAPTPTDHAAGGTVEIRCLFRLEWARRVEDWTVVARLAPFHVYREEVARERFAYADRHHHAGALTLAFGRVFRLAAAGTPWRFADSPAFGGCRSWIELPEPPPGLELTPVLDEATHRARAEAIRRAISGQN